MIVSCFDWSLSAYKTQGAYDVSFDTIRIASVDYKPR